MWFIIMYILSASFCSNNISIEFLFMFKFSKIKTICIANSEPSLDCFLYYVFCVITKSVLFLRNESSRIYVNDRN